MKHENFATNTGRNYYRNQCGLIEAVADAREVAARYKEAFVVYFGADNYGYWRKPLINCPEKFAAITAREICQVQPDGSLMRMAA